jgi:hypothetical protein
MKVSMKLTESIFDNRFQIWHICSDSHYWERQSNGEKITLLLNIAKDKILEPNMRANVNLKLVSHKENMGSV